MFVDFILVIGMFGIGIFIVNLLDLVFFKRQQNFAKSYLTIY